jgi:hypothetical protein
MQSSSKKTTNKSRYAVPDHFQKASEAGVQIELARLSLSLSENPISLFGDTFLTKEAQVDYMKHIRGLRYFFQ